MALCELLVVESGSAAESGFQLEFDMAEGLEGLDARMFQLRSSVRLCRLWRDQGSPREVSRPLRALSETFTEGFATADLLEARDVLDSR